MALELPPARTGRQARPLGHAPRQRRQSARARPGRPQGQDDIVIDGGDLHLPVGKPVKALLRSIDVLHDFYVPEIRAKMDMVPGIVTYFWFTPTRTGTFEALCAELCGIGHPQMRGVLVVDEQGPYQTWLGTQRPLASLRAAQGGPATKARSLAAAEPNKTGAERTQP